MKSRPIPANPLLWFQRAILCCQNECSSVLDMMARTDEALYVALMRVYRIYLQIKTYSILRQSFYHELNSKNMRIGDNEALTLVELSFFPYVLERDKRTRRNNKPDIDKASSYAKAISYARAKAVEPEDFVEFIRENGGIQDTAKAETERLAQRDRDIGVHSGKPISARAAPGSAPRRGVCQFPVTLWCSNELAAEISESMEDSYYGGSIDRFVIHGERHDATNAIVTRFAEAPKATLPKRPMGQSNGKGGPSSQASNPAKAMRPTAPKRTPSHHPGRRLTPLGKKMFGKAPSGKTVWR